MERLEQANETEALSQARFERLVRKARSLSEETVPLLLERLRSSDGPARRFAAKLLIAIGDESLLGTLHQMLEEPSLTLEQKSDILPLFTIFGGPQDEETLSRFMPEPARHLEQSIVTLLEDIERPESGEGYLRGLEMVEPETRAAFVRDWLVSRADRRLLSVFAALLHHEQHDVVLAAIDGLERIKEPAMVPLLKERARRDPSRQVRRAAESAYLRLEVRAADREPLAWLGPPRYPLAHCFISTIDGNGGQVLFLCYQMPSGDYHVLDLVFNDHEGLKDCYGFPADGATIAGLLEEFRPLELIEVSAQHSYLAIERARQKALQTFRRFPPAFVLYEGWLGGGAGANPYEHPLPVLDPLRGTDLLRDSDQLLDLDEFESWYFNPDEVETYRERYLGIPDRLAEQASPSLLALLRYAVEEIVDADYCTLIADRLRRQAWLLAQVYEDETIPLWALAAARGLDRGTLAEHPLLLAMMDTSMLRAFELTALLPDQAM